MAHADAMNPGPLASPLARQKPNRWLNVLAGVVIVDGIIYVGYQLAEVLSVIGEARAFLFVLLGIALAIALGFEVVNGFYDTADAVATVIYANSLSPNLAASVSCKNTIKVSALYKEPEGG